MIISKYSYKLDIYTVIKYGSMLVWLLTHTAIRPGPFSGPFTNHANDRRIHQRASPFTNLTTTTVIF